MRTKLFCIIIGVALLIGNLIPVPGVHVARVHAQDTHRADALVLVNSTSPNYIDFQYYIQPYLDNFGVPYTIVNIATTPVGQDVGNYAVIIIGHRQLDTTGIYLDMTEQGYITAAVSAGTGLVNFDNDLSMGGSTHRYQFIQDIFGFGYTTPTTGSGVTFTSMEGGGSYQINCWEDSHQSPVLPTFSDASLVNWSDNQWDEFLYTTRGYPAVFAGYNETPPLMRFYGSVPDGEYTVIAHLYWSHNLRYYWGYTSENPLAYSIDVTSGNSGEFADYTLGTTTVTGGEFNIYVQKGDALTGGAANEAWGWAWIRLVPVGGPPPTMHYITALHNAGDAIGTGGMTMAGITLPIGVTGIAMTGSEPFLAVATAGQGRAVQWGTYDWMS